MKNTYKHILVPLDGSQLSEVALKDALILSGLSNAEVSLLRVVEPMENIIKLDEHHAIFIDEQWKIYKKQAFEYIDSIRKQLDPEPAKVNCVVEMGHAAETIIEYAQKHSVDIIVMATHGRSGLKQWVYGSVAGKVLRGAHHPVLLVRSYEEKKARELTPRNP